jgi:hypothetical protein
MRLANEKDVDSVIEWLGFKGLDIQPDVLSRPFDSWRRLENCDLFVPGSIRKIIGPKFLGGPYVSTTPPPPPPLQMVNLPVQQYESTGSDQVFGPPPTLPLTATVLLQTDIQPGDLLIALVTVQGYAPGVGSVIGPLDALANWNVIDGSIAAVEGLTTILSHVVGGGEGPTVTFSYSSNNNFSGYSMNVVVIAVRYADNVNPVTKYVSTTAPANFGPTNNFNGPVTDIANTLIFALYQAYDKKITPGNIAGTSLIFDTQSVGGQIFWTGAMWEKPFVGPGATGAFNSPTGWSSAGPNPSDLILAINSAPIPPPTPPQPQLIVEMAAYKQFPTTPFVDIGIGNLGGLFDLISGAHLGDLGGDPGQPFVCMFPGTAFGGAAILYLLSTMKGAPPKKYDGINVTDIGVTPPIGPVAVQIQQSASNTNAYLMQLGIQYLWTYFNSETLHESSPSPVDNTSIITPVTNHPALATPFITQIKLTIPTPDPAVGTGYNRIRVYRTRDGGQTFFLLPKVRAADGTNLSDANLSIARTSGAAMVVYDGVTATNNAPADDALLVSPPGGAPAIDSHDPPPPAVWGAVYQSRYWLVKEDLKTLVFSGIGDFQSFPIDNFFTFPKDILDEITALVALSDRLIVNGKNSARQITGTDFSDFVEVPVDMRRGSLGRRSAASDGDNIYVLTAQSLARLAFQVAGPPFIGDHIKPLTDSILAAAQQSIICMDIDTPRSILVFAIKVAGVTYNDQIILADLGRESPFSIIKGLPTEVITVRELEFADGTLDMVFSGADGNTYRLYDSSGGNGSLVAVAETQELPLVDVDIWKTFQHFVPIGTDFANWKLAYSVDGGATFNALRPMFTKNPIGLSGKTCIIQLTHNVNNGVAAILSRAKLKYEPKMGAQ